MRSALLPICILLACKSSASPKTIQPEPTVDVPETAELGGKPLRCAFGPADAKVELRIAMPKGLFTIKSKEEQCTVFAGEDPKSAELLVHFMLVSDLDAGTEQLLNIEPDGVRQFLLKSILENGKTIDEGALTLLGKSTQFYRLSGTLDGVERELLATRVVLGEHNFVAAVIHGLDDGKRLEQAFAILAGLTNEASPLAGSGQNREVLRGKAVEAKVNLKKISDAAHLYFDTQNRATSAQRAGAPAAHRFPASIAPTPPLGSCCKNGGQCAADPSLWQTPTWEALGFAMSGPHYYSYEVKTTIDEGVESIAAYAYGDLDCDGEYSTYFMYSGVVDGALLTTGDVGIEDALE